MRHTKACQGRKRSGIVAIASEAGGHCPAMSSDNIIRSEAGSEAVAGTVPDGQRGAKTVLIVCSRLFREALMLVLDRPGTTFSNGIATVDEALALMEGGFVPDLTIAVLIGEDTTDEAMKAIVRARRSFPGTRWLLLTDSVSPRRLRQAIAAGVDGLLQHEITAHILRHATELLLLGQTLLPKGLAEYGERPREPEPAQPRDDPAIAITGSTSEPAPGTQAAPTTLAVSVLPVQLSERERQILGCLARGDFEQADRTRATDRGRNRESPREGSAAEVARHKPHPGCCLRHPQSRTASTRA